MTKQEARKYTAVMIAISLSGLVVIFAPLGIFPLMGIIASYALLLLFLQAVV
ncbi:MAG: hypothetical protein J07AB43_00170 [Candidatus Nanosalina sp. J07AB43]|nr:MAG: hypothetical protein J07AB43_00170 [Candidatus Nanosalina sp. J07AB43]